MKMDREVEVKTVNEEIGSGDALWWTSETRTTNRAIRVEIVVLESFGGFEGFNESREGREVGESVYATLWGSIFQGVSKCQEREVLV